MHNEVYKILSSWPHLAKRYRIFPCHPCPVALPGIWKWEEQKKFETNVPTRHSKCIDRCNQGKSNHRVSLTVKLKLSAKYDKRMNSCHIVNSNWYYTFCCSLPENIISLMPTSNSLTQNDIHFIQSHSLTLLSLSITIFCIESYIH